MLSTVMLRKNAASTMRTANAGIVTTASATVLITSSTHPPKNPAVKPRMMATVMPHGVLFRGGKEKLIRELFVDDDVIEAVIGLPPSPDEVHRFINDNAPNAYEQLIERLLQSPHYGERMAIGWLDVVRFADTIGYHSDNPRNVWPYRDWVINSFNDNKPFDRFTIEQVAGDLLPDANTETRGPEGRQGR
jgi:hypothetical protein